MTDETDWVTTGDCRHDDLRFSVAFKVNLDPDDPEPTCWIPRIAGTCVACGCVWEGVPHGSNPGQPFVMLMSKGPASEQGRTP